MTIRAPTGRSPFVITVATSYPSVFDWGQAERLETRMITKPEQSKKAHTAAAADKEERKDQ